MNVNWALWALRLAIIALGFIFGYLMAERNNLGVIETYFSYCEEEMP